MSKQLPPAPTASAIGPCPTIIQIVGRPGTGSLSRTTAPPDQPQHSETSYRCHNMTTSNSFTYMYIVYANARVSTRMTELLIRSTNREIEGLMCGSESSYYCHDMTEILLEGI